MTITEVETAPSLKDVVKYSVRALIRRFHLNRDWIIGLIGERGAGKSLGGANIAIRDFMMNGEPCWSNMNIKMTVNIKGDNPFTNDSGAVIYEAQHIEKKAFLALDGKYEGGCLYFDEFNLEYGEARRSSSNVNLYTDRAVQQLRKLQCGLVYTVLNEMYVDPRIRENTDVFIKCQDVAFNPGNLVGKMEQGHVFEWLLYPISTRLAGNGQTYLQTHKPIGPIQITMHDSWGVIDTYERQAVGQQKYSEMKKLMPVEMAEDPVVLEDRDRWGWLDEFMREFYERHATDGDVIEISAKDLRAEMGIEKKYFGATINQLCERIKGIEGIGGAGYTTRKYKIPNRVLV